MDFYGKKQLVSVRDGKAAVPAEDKGGYEADQWYLLKSEIIDGNEMLQEVYF